MFSNSSKKTPGPERRTFAKGATIFKEGDRADAAYIVESGAIDIFKIVGGRRVSLGTIRPWGLFGELGLLDDSPRMAAARAAEETTCMVVSRQSIEQMLEGAPEGLRVLFGSLAQTIRTAGEELASARFQLMESVAD
jgi:CRP/FNR family transcriptional regulator, cyclic AMP receptor protein